MIIVRSQRFVPGWKTGDENPIYPLPAKMKLHNKQFEMFYFTFKMLHIVKKKKKSLTFKEAAKFW